MRDLAADGAWPEAGGADVRTQRAVQHLRAMLQELEGRLGRPPASTQRHEAVDGLVEALQELARHVARLETDQAERYAHLDAALGQLAQRLEIQAESQAADAASAAERDGRTSQRLDEAFEALAEVAGAREPWPIRTALSVAAAAAALSVMGAATLAIRQGGGELAMPAPVSAISADLPLRPSLKAESRPAPRPVTPSSSVVPPPLPGTRPETYDEVAGALGRGDGLALSRLTGLAQNGDGRAQMHLASLYEAGEGGLPRDLAAARTWTRRAAETGERVAMHNLALFLSQGEGGPRDPVEAAVWFRRAADRGVVDSQYNLGLLYEAGRGVAPNLREAYRWFSVAANAGDLASREKAVALESRLRPGEREGLDREAARYQPENEAGIDLATVIPPATTLAETQALLARKGYYVGPVDGIFTAEVKAAAQAYLRDNPGTSTSRPASPPL